MKMKINKEIAQKIVSRTMKIIPYSVNVMNEQGIIIASGNPQRLKQKHTGAVLAIRENRIVEITSQLAEKWNFEAREGINLPISYQGQILGVVGISGDPTEVKSFAELVKMAAELIIEQAFILQQERWHHHYRESFFLAAVKQPRLSEELKKQATGFGIDFHDSLRCIVVQLSEANEENLYQLFAYLEQHYSAEMIVLTSFNQICILQAVDKTNGITPTSSWIKSLPVKVKVAVGGVFSGEQSLYFSYITAMSTLEYGLKKQPLQRIYLFENYKLPTLFETFFSSWQSQQLFLPLQPLCEEKYLVLRKSLAQYFSSNCDLLLTSQQLFIHPNSLRYRLHKIEQLTRLSFNKIEDKFILFLFSLYQMKLEKKTKK